MARARPRDRRARSRSSRVDDDGLLRLEVLDDAARDRHREGRGGRARLQRRRHRQPGRRHRRPRPRGRRGRGRRRRAGRAADGRSTSGRSTPTSTPGPGTRPTARPAWACCTAGAALLDAMPPFLGGGHMISQRHRGRDPLGRGPRGSSRRGRRTSPRRSAWAPAVDFLSEIGMDAVRAHERDAHRLRARAPRGGARRDDQRAGRRGRRGALVSFTLDLAHPHDVAEILGSRGVCVRAGHHCAQPLMKLPRRRRDDARVLRRAQQPHRRRRARRRASTRSGGCSLVSGMDAMYREEILEHYKRPHNWGHSRSRIGSRVRGHQPALRRRAAR